MPLPAPEIFKLLEFQFKEGPIGIGFFMINLIWSHYEPVTKLSVVLMCLTTLILVFYRVFGRPPDKSLSLVKHGSNMWSKMYHSEHKYVFAGTFLVKCLTFV